MNNKGNKEITPKKLATVAANQKRAVESRGLRIPYQANLQRAESQQPESFRIPATNVVKTSKIYDHVKSKVETHWRGSNRRVVETFCYSSEVSLTRRPSTPKYNTNDCTARCNYPMSTAPSASSLDSMDPSDFKEEDWEEGDIEARLNSSLDDDNPSCSPRSVRSHRSITSIRTDSYPYSEEEQTTSQLSLGPTTSQWEVVASGGHDQQQMLEFLAKTHPYLLSSDAFQNFKRDLRNVFCGSSSSCPICPDLATTFDERLAMVLDRWAYDLFKLFFARKWPEKREEEQADEAAEGKQLVELMAPTESFAHNRRQKATPALHALISAMVKRQAKPSPIYMITKSVR
ncbi:uncharacterized protein DMAD_01524 [Drosophila madeirensis]|uniref:Uncharacterized protein n=1 Tax=Drosophila madeirensis TaxID=30013 RepID=A0AAU9G049_DROMD